MTPRETVIEAMARAVCAEEGHNPDMPLRDGARVAWKNYVPSATAALNALLSALPDLGLKIVPIEADEAMAEAWAGASIDTASAGLPDNEVNMLHAQSDWSAMIAAAPDPLGTGKQALKDNTPNPLRNEMGV